MSLYWRTWGIRPEIGDRPDSDLPEVIIQTDKAESRGHDFGCDGPRKKWVVILPRSRQILIHAYKKMLALPKVSRAGGGVVFHHVAFLAAQFQRVFPSYLLGWREQKETGELVDSWTRLTKGYAVLLSILAQRKEIKKNIVNRLKPSQKLVSSAFVSAKLSIWRPRTGYLFSPKIHTFKYLSTY